MIYRLTGATVRAVIVAILVMLPAFLLTGTTQSAIEFTRILATMGAVFVIYEYGFSSPSVIEFRYAAPYNRVRFLLLLILVLTPTYLISSLLDGHTVNGFLSNAARNGFAFMDFAYSPVAIVANTLAGDNLVLREIIGQAIILNAIICLSFSLAFCISVMLNFWQFGGENFNMWLNMPTYKSYNIHSLQSRLINSSFSSLLIACLIPIFGPTLADVVLSQGTVITPITIIWVIALWTYLPAMFLMRSVALAKVAMSRDDKAEWMPI
ncbi:MAG: hypothetical protein JKX71_10990 [Amylibacter sp.]|nr:hypothetical protein [Amylibacter sp.]